MSIYKMLDPLKQLNSWLFQKLRGFGNRVALG